jgi:hypothetical protein
MVSFSYKLFAPLIALLPIRIAIAILYFRRFKTFPNIKKPITFNEKLQYRKLYDRNPLLTVVADKLASKEYIKSKKLDIYIPKVIWQGYNLENINISKLPLAYVYKANHASRTNAFITNGEHYTKEKMDSLRKQWFSHDQSSVLGEWAYRDILKEVFIEEYLDFQGTVPDDYKFFVYHGKVKFIQLDSGRFNEHKRNMFDENWNDLNIDFSHERLIPTPKKPEFMDKMIKLAEIIGNDFDFIRVDFYYYKNMVTFGEITVYPGAGFEKFPTKEWDIEFGKHWIIS